jgi:hypothetical protein
MITTKVAIAGRIPHPLTLQILVGLDPSEPGAGSIIAIDILLF